MLEHQSKLHSEKRKKVEQKKPTDLKSKSPKDTKGKVEEGNLYDDYNWYPDHKIL